MTETESFVGRWLMVMKGMEDGEETGGGSRRWRWLPCRIRSSLVSVDRISALGL